ncbi:hypothetical protein [Catellatospora sp. NPDC049609]|uniref:hypothetical protein n=1 Tax=Catellatospora sp. NPDC049609 TaxID=3155505 RepID=UPI00341C50DD
MNLRCHSMITVPDGVYEFLAAVPDGQYQLPRWVACDLQEDHREGHVGFLQSMGEAEETAWWLAWSGTAGEPTLIQLPYCCEDCSTADACLLPDGHPGRHSSQLITALDLTPGMRLPVYEPSPSR